MIVSLYGAVAGVDLVEGTQDRLSEVFRVAAEHSSKLGNAIVFTRQHHAVAS